MTRFEKAACLVIVAGLIALNAPAFGQVVITDGLKVEPARSKDRQSGKTTVRKKDQPPPQPETPTFTATGSAFESTKEKAKESAIRAAVEKLHEYLMEQNPQISKYPTTEMVRKMLLEDQETVTEEPDPIAERAGKKEMMYKTTVAVKVKPQDVRSMRGRERSSEALWVLAGIGGLAAVLGVFFRIDSWTKGYLTSWLVLGTVGAASLLGGLWWMAK
jgi:hypothetical protein